MQITFVCISKYPDSRMWENDWVYCANGLFHAMSQKITSPITILPKKMATPTAIPMNMSYPTSNGIALLDGPGFDRQGSFDGSLNSLSALTFQMPIKDYEVHLAQFLSLFKR